MFGMACVIVKGPLFGSFPVDWPISTSRLAARKNDLHYIRISLSSHALTAVDSQPSDSRRAVA